MENKKYTVDVNLKERSYQVVVGHHIFDEFAQYLLSLQVNHQVAIISTPPVSDLYQETILNCFDREWFVNCYDVPDGEKSKSAEIIADIYDWMLENRYERNSTIIALGGGVIGDLAGFVASTYLRGINLVHVPTTLLAQVDSSIGGKVGINHPKGKNLIGAFYQPRCVFTDISFLKTLPEEEYICGLGEVVKYAILSPEINFNDLEINLESILHMDEQLLPDIVQACIRIKADIVQEDEKEQGIRAYLNLGHTFAHALETFYHYEGFKHGQAVLLGIKCACMVSQSLKLIDEEAVHRIHLFIDKLGIKLPSTKIPDAEQLVEIMKRDKKMKDGKIHLVLPRKIGSVAIVEVADEKLLKDSYAALLT